MFLFFLAIESYRTTESTQDKKEVGSIGGQILLNAKTISYFRICPSHGFCRAQNLPNSSVKLIWPITELFFRQILATDFMNRSYLDVKTGPRCLGKI